MAYVNTGQYANVFSYPGMSYFVELILEITDTLNCARKSNFVCVCVDFQSTGCLCFVFNKFILISTLLTETFNCIVVLGRMEESL